MRRVVVVGASAAGLATAAALRQQGFGGLITMIGDEPHLPYDRPPLSKQVLTGQWDAERLLLRPESDLKAMNLDLRLGVSATAVDRTARTVTLAHGGTVPYDALVIATGVRPRLLPGGHGRPGVHVLRTREDALALRDRLGDGRRLVIIGGGFLGTEVAAAARQRGADVTIVESGAEPLARIIGRAAGRFITGIHRDRGVRILTGLKAETFDTADGAVTGVRLDDGRTLPADDVLVATGSVPNTDWLRGSGLDIDDGLLCDAHGRCAPGIHAAGDVARWFNPLFGRAIRVEHRTSASEQGIAVARDLLTPATPQPAAPVPYFWTDQYEVKVQSHGYLPGHEESAVLDGDLAEGRALIGYRRGRHLTGVLAIGMPAKDVRPWRAAVARRTEWAAVTSAPTPAR
ncbi:NAD(P)/FAD-dependent oxidoreductase [Streptomyces olivaceoviridis]|uniref:NAD(P)/FAD-dependent oxidoreductase n=1 Tax=Streptomyces olivaceoviridis TaxID=1921 RepID=UPI0016755366|nr:FAD-dependent oxidoreductase [Streptomyces olivaceoviridis]